MAKTISDPKYVQTKTFIETHIEPRIKEIVDHLNLTMSKRGIRVGVELTWFFDEIEASNEGNENNEA